MESELQRRISFANMYALNPIYVTQLVLILHISNVNLNFRISRIILDSLLSYLPHMVIKRALGIGREPLLNISFLLCH